MGTGAVAEAVALELPSGCVWFLGVSSSQHGAWVSSVRNRRRGEKKGPRGYSVAEVLGHLSLDWGWGCHSKSTPSWLRGMKGDRVAQMRIWGNVCEVTASSRAFTGYKRF